MPQRNRKPGRIAYLALLLGISATAARILYPVEERGADSVPMGRKPTAYSQLVGTDPMPEPEMKEGETCQWVPATSQMLLAAAIRQERLAARPATSADARTGAELDRAPLRVIRDPYSTYSAVAVDPLRNEIVLQDENLFKIMVYDRLANTPPKANMTEPKRVIGGDDTKVEFNCGLYIDPTTGDIYSISNDTVDTMVVFSRNARGNVRPDRELHTPHRTFGIAVNEQDQELYLTVQHPPAVVVYGKMASGDEAPIRIIEGDNTRLEDPHGIALDTKNKWIFISNHGAFSLSKDGKNFTRHPIVGGGWKVPDEGERRRNMAPGSGKFEPPSITVYPLKATEDTPPLRVIEGSKTQLNWPSQIFLDEEAGELFVANDVGDSIVVFRATDNGNVAPLRVLKGLKTGIKNPTGVFIDRKNDELVVASMGNHTATVYHRTAQGDTPPLRTIRSGPMGTQAQAIGNPGALAYDTKRDEILVPN